MRTVILGANSQIAQEFNKLLSKETVRGHLDYVNSEEDSFLICTGYLKGWDLRDHIEHSLNSSFMVNYVKIATYCDKVFEINPRARICIIGSESGFKGSYDMAYAGAKAAMHLYIETKKLGPLQQLVGISPTIIGDARMTTVRKDIENLERRKQEHPKRRFLKSIEVARLAKFLLYDDEGYTTNTVIRMHGGAV